MLPEKTTKDGLPSDAILVFVPRKALEKVTFKIEAGERIGIIGRVGSGKTTVGRLLLGFYEALKYPLLVDGVDSREYDPSDWRSGIGFAMQDTHLFFGKFMRQYCARCS